MLNLRNANLPMSLYSKIHCRFPPRRQGDSHEVLIAQNQKEKEKKEEKREMLCEVQKCLCGCVGFKGQGPQAYNLRATCRDLILGR